jgi:hypothetical protein
MRCFGNRPPVAIERSEGLLIEHLQHRGHQGLPGLAADRRGGALQSRLDQRRSSMRSCSQTRCAPSTTVIVDVTFTTATLSPFEDYVPATRSRASFVAAATSNAGEGSGFRAQPPAYVWRGPVG